jgi:hypothetical protein
LRPGYNLPPFLVYDILYYTILLFCSRCLIYYYVRFREWAPIVKGRCDNNDNNNRAGKGFSVPLRRYGKATEHAQGALGEREREREIKRLRSDYLSCPYWAMLAI